MGSRTHTSREKEEEEEEHLADSIYERRRPRGDLGKKTVVVGKNGMARHRISNVFIEECKRQIQTEERLT